MHYLYKLIPPRPTFALDMSEAEAEIMSRHGGYWQQLALRGTAIVFGPVADPGGFWGLAVVEADDEDAVHALGDADPAITSRLARFEVCAMPATVVRPSANAA